MRGCTRCGATYATGVLYCPQDGAATVEVASVVVPPGEQSRPISTPGAAFGATAPSSIPPTPNSRPPAAADPFIGKMVGNFRLSRRLGAGGMGAVYEGVHPIVGIRVAVKLLGGSFALDHDLVERFFAEARTLNQVAHENIVKVIDLGVHAEGFYYCVMELLEGDTLSSLMQHGRTELAHGLGILQQMCDGLAAAHEKGIVHRDLKPSNIMLAKHPASGAELVKLVDFGIAKLQTTQPQANQTVTGTVIGTPAYMSPEQAAGRIGDIDPRSDLYSMGLIAYELFTGHHPFEGRPVGELIVAQITETPPPAARLTPLPRRLDETITRLLKKRKDERFPNATAVGLEIRGIAESLRTAAMEGSNPASQPPRTASSSSISPIPVMTPASPNPAPPPTTAAAPPTASAGNAPPRTGVHVSPRPYSSTPPPEPALTLAPQAPSLRKDASDPGRAKAGKPAARRVREPAGPTVRPFFLLALATASGVLCATLIGVLDAEPIVARAAAALGLAPPLPKYLPKLPPNVDGTALAFTTAAKLEECRVLFDKLRAVTLTAETEQLQARLHGRLEIYDRLDECLRKHAAIVPVTKEWVVPYVQGVAAFEFAMALDHLPREARLFAKGLQNPKHGGTPFDSALYALQAADRLNAARPGAPEVQQSLIDGYLIDLDVLKQRARRAEEAATAAVVPAKSAQPAPEKTSEGNP